MDIAMDDEKLYQIALGMIPGVGRLTMRQLISYTGSARAVLHTPKGRLLKIPGVGEKTAEAIRQGEKLLPDAQLRLEKAMQAGMGVCFFTDKHFPRRLRDVHDAPVMLYTKGNIDMESRRTVAVVGTRKATEYGRRFTAQLIADLSPLSVNIISGLAYGIDICAHREALKNKLSTIAVLGSGLDRIYPEAHKATAQSMLEQGGLISEYAPGTPPDAPHFPERNRIVAALADAIVVVEAAISGGALITADIANSYNREVFAVPGPVDARYSEGCNQLIKMHKAHLITSAADLVYLMNWHPENEKALQTIAKSLPEDLEPEELNIYKLLAAQNEMHLDDLAWLSQLGVSKAAVALLSLEFKGLVKAMPGKKYALA
jgi:DNA processing protein